jgi:hypothetical protein
MDGAYVRLRRDEAITASPNDDGRRRRVRPQSLANVIDGAPISGATRQT